MGEAFTHSETIQADHDDDDDDDKKLLYLIIQATSNTPD